MNKNRTKSPHFGDDRAPSSCGTEAAYLSLESQKWFVAAEACTNGNFYGLNLCMPNHLRSRVEGCKHVILAAPAAATSLTVLTHRATLRSVV